MNPEVSGRPQTLERDRDGGGEQRPGPGGAAEGPLLSIVVPAHGEAANLPHLHRELVEALAAEGPWELIVVDDGSPDDTWRVIAALCAADPRVRGLRLSRNFGHQYALFAGMAEARGAAVVTMDADLQHPPATVPELLAAWRAGARIVHTLRIDPAGLGWWKRTSSALFYRLFSFLSGVDLSSGMADFRLLDRQVVDELLRFREDGLFLRGLVHWVGFQSARIPFQCRERLADQSKYGLRRMLRLAGAGITSFSVIPLRLGILLGLVTSLFAFYQLGEALFVHYVTGETLPGWTSTFGVMTLLFGVMFILMGILGEYLGRILLEVRGRPRYIVADRAGGGVDHPAGMRFGGGAGVDTRQSSPRELPAPGAERGDRE